SSVRSTFARAALARERSGESFGELVTFALRPTIVSSSFGEGRAELGHVAGRFTGAAVHQGMRTAEGRDRSTLELHRDEEARIARPTHYACAMLGLLHVHGSLPSLHFAWIARERGHGQICGCHVESAAV